MTETRTASRRVPFLILAGFFLVFAGPGATQGFLKNLVPESWSPLKITSILAALYFSFMMWRIFIIATQRAIGDKWSFTLGLAAYLLAPLVLWWTTNYAALIAAAVVWGWGSAGLWQTGPVWLYDETDGRRRGLWAGLLYMLVFLGLIIGARLQGHAAGVGNRRLLLLVAIWPGVAGAVLAALLPRRPARAQRLSPAAIGAMLADRRVVLLGVLLFFSAPAYGLLLGAFRDKVETAFGADAVGSTLGVYFAARLVVSLLGGYAGDVLRRRSVMAAAFFAGGAALAVASALDAHASLITAAACLGLVSAVVPVSTTAFSADWFPPEKRSLALGAAFVWRDAGMVLSLLAGQYLAQATGGFRVPFLVFASLFVASALIALALPEGAPAVSRGDSAQ